MVVKAIFTPERIITENSDQAKEFYNTGRFGKILTHGKVQLSLLEAMYLLEKERLIVLDGKNKEITFDMFLQKAQHKEKNFWTRYCVYKDIRDRGYIIKTALKFGAS